MSGSPAPVQQIPDGLRRHGFTDPASEALLEGLVAVASAFCGGRAGLQLEDESGVWYRCQVDGPGEGELETLDLADVSGRHLGRLWAAIPPPLLESQRLGLALTAERICALLNTHRERAERRAAPRGPAGTSFVPGLAHELRNFVFAISATLDAFEARLGREEGNARYTRVLREGVERLNAFVDELREYGDPQALDWRVGNLELILREAIEHHRPAAAKAGVDLRLALEAPLPRLRMDGSSLRAAFIRLLGLALQQGTEGGAVALHAGTREQGGRQVVFGHVDATGMKLQGVDLARLFEPFYYRASGLGRLALPAARRIFEAHGGNLSAAEGPEGGLRMGFMLPAP
jgi:signal transduction histidine kinase